MNPLVQEAKFTIMCDVDNPLCGPNGATMCYGKQKGGTVEVLEELERGMENYRQVLLKTFGKDVNSWLRCSRRYRCGLLIIPNR